MTPKAMFVRWLLYVIQNARTDPTDVRGEPAEEPHEGIVVSGFQGRTFRIRVEEVVDAG